MFPLPPWIGLISRSYAANAEVLVSYAANAEVLISYAANAEVLVSYATNAEVLVSYSRICLVQNDISPFCHTVKNRNIIFLVEVS
jgi:hypothetical protein